MSPLRTATPTDLAKLGALAIDVGYPAYDHAALGAALDRGAILLTDGADAFALVEIAADEAELHLIVVAPGARRSGLGGALLRACVDEARARGALRLFLEVAAGNDAGIALYQKAGLTEIGRRRAYYRDGQDALLFSLALG